MFAPHFELGPFQKIAKLLDEGSEISIVQYLRLYGDVLDLYLYDPSASVAAQSSWEKRFMEGIKNTRTHKERVKGFLMVVLASEKGTQIISNQAVQDIKTKALISGACAISELFDELSRFNTIPMGLRSHVIITGSGDKSVSDQPDRKSLLNVRQFVYTTNRDVFLTEQGNQEESLTCLRRLGKLANLETSGIEDSWKGNGSVRNSPREGESRQRVDSKDI